MARFRKLPVEIDAVQNTGEWAPIIEFLATFGADRVPFGGTPPITRLSDGRLVVRTLEGAMCAEVGDWIIRGVKGELYPCKPDIFEQTYVPAPDGTIEWSDGTQA